MVFTNYEFSQPLIIAADLVFAWTIRCALYRFQFPFKPFINEKVTMCIDPLFGSLSSDPRIDLPTQITCWGVHCFRQWIPWLNEIVYIIRWLQFLRMALLL